jgi:hypothetical protein
MSADKAVLSVEIGNSVMDDLDYMDNFDNLAKQHGFVEDEDYHWYVAYGDDMPNGLDIYNSAMLANAEIVDLATLHEGVSCYS